MIGIIFFQTDVVFSIKANMTVVDCQTETVSDALVAQRLAQHCDDHVTQAGLTLSSLTHKQVY